MADYACVGSTVLPDQSMADSGLLRFGHNSTRYLAGGDAPFPTGTFSVALYCTSGIDLVDTSDTYLTDNGWQLISRKSYNCVYHPIAPYEIADFAFTHDRFSSANSFAIKLSKPTGDYVRTTLYPIYLLYATTNTVVLDSGASVGRFSYLVMDGGYSG